MAKFKKDSQFEVLDTATKKIKSLNHGLRQKIIAYLREVKQSNVTDLFKKLKIEQAVASQHLGILRDNNFVKTEHQGKQRIYSVNEKKISELIENTAKI